MENGYDGYVNGYIERNQHGQYAGSLTVEGVNLSPVEGQYFKKDGDMYLFIKRRPIMEYDTEKCVYTTRERRPPLSIYMKKKVGGDGVVAYEGEFMFLRFKFRIVGTWDTVVGKELHRLNLFVERAPRSEQTILNAISERNNKKG